MLRNILSWELYQQSKEVQPKHTGFPVRKGLLKLKKQYVIEEFFFLEIALNQPHPIDRNICCSILWLPIIFDSLLCDVMASQSSVGVVTAMQPLVYKADVFIGPDPGDPLHINLHVKELLNSCCRTLTSHRRF